MLDYFFFQDCDGNEGWNVEYIHQYLNYNVCGIIYQKHIEASHRIPSHNIQLFHYSFSAH